MLALVDQYLQFIAEARKLRLELAADYLVMAAWLAFLKSRLLLPAEAKPRTRTSGEELARRLSFRLMRLEAMREAVAQLLNRMRLGRDVFQRGMPEGIRTIRKSDLLGDRLRPAARPTPTSAAAPQGRAGQDGRPQGLVDQATRASAWSG